MFLNLNCKSFKHSLAQCNDSLFVFYQAALHVQVSSISGLLDPETEPGGVDRYSTFCRSHADVISLSQFLNRGSVASLT